MDDGYSTIEVTVTESGGLLTVTLAGGNGNVLTEPPDFWIEF